VTVFLLIQTALLYSSIRTEIIPPSRSLSELPREMNGWRMTQEGVIDPESQAILKADDLLTRVYTDPSGRVGASLFVAAFRSQRNGKAPHSPKNCLPGNGWTPLESGEYPLEIGASQPILVNRYIIVHGDTREMVMYWYQSRNRVIASEYKAKFWVVADAMRLNRTDTALVRVIVPITDRDEEGATRIGADFVRAFFNTLRDYLPA
jgi:EpsI family protein